MSDMFPRLKTPSNVPQQADSTFFGDGKKDAFFDGVNPQNMHESTLTSENAKGKDKEKPLNEYSTPKKEHFYFIHGTGSTPRVWKKYDGQIIDMISDGFGDENKVDEVHTEKWNGANNSTKRALAIELLVKKIYSYHSQNVGEPITIVGHSHGGNIALEVANKLSYALPNEKITLITLNTPVRADYQPKYNENTKHYNFFIPNDEIQTRAGGFNVTGKILDPNSGLAYGLPALPPKGFLERKIIIMISNRLLNIFGEVFNVEVKIDESILPRMGGESGTAENQFDCAVNIQVDSRIKEGKETELNKPLRHRLWHKKNLPALKREIIKIKGNL